MKTSYRKQVYQVIEKADVIVEVLDARMIDMTRNLELEALIAQKGKRLIHAINKADLVAKDFLEEKAKQLTNCVFLSGRYKMGTSFLRDMIYRVAAKDKESDIFVGIIGYPNVGKSSVINALHGSRSANVSPRSGFTKSIQHIRVTNRIILIDTPGVIPFEEKDVAKLAIVGSKNPEQLKDPEMAAYELFKVLVDSGDAHVLQKKYEVEVEPIDTLLERIALHKHRLLKKGEPDTKTMSRIILQDWQRGIL